MRCRNKTLSDGTKESKVRATMGMIMTDSSGLLLSCLGYREVSQHTEDLKRACSSIVPYLHVIFVISLSEEKEDRVKKDRE